MKRFSKMLGAFALCMGLLASPAQAEKFVVGFQPYDTISYQAIINAELTAPEAGGSSGLDGDTTFLLLRHEVHGGGAVVGLADLVVLTGVEQNTLGGSGLTGIDVSHDADVTDLVEIIEHV